MSRLQVAKNLKKLPMLMKIRSFSHLRRLLIFPFYLFLYSIYTTDPNFQHHFSAPRGKVCDQTFLIDMFIYIFILLRHVQEGS